MRYIISFISNVLHSIFAFKPCRKAKRLGNRTFAWSLGVTTPPITPVTKLDLGFVFFFFFIYIFSRLCPSLSPFINTFYHYYYLLLSIIFLQFTPWKRQDELCNHFVKGHPSSIKFTITVASRVLHSLLGTMFTVSLSLYMEYVFTVWWSVNPKIIPDIENLA